MCISSPICRPCAPTRTRRWGRTTPEPRLGPARRRHGSWSVARSHPANRRRTMEPTGPLVHRRKRSRARRVVIDDQHRRRRTDRRRHRQYGVVCVRRGEPNTAAGDELRHVASAPAQASAMTVARIDRRSGFAHVRPLQRRTAVQDGVGSHPGHHVDAARNADEHRRAAPDATKDLLIRCTHDVVQRAGQPRQCRDKFGATVRRYFASRRQRPHRPATGPNPRTAASRR